MNEELARGAEEKRRLEEGLKKVSSGGVRQYISNPHMKTRLSFAVLLLVPVVMTMAIIVMPFEGWDELKHRSRDILIVRCMAVNTQDYYKDGVVPWDIEIVSVLKGTNQVGRTEFFSLYNPCVNKNYLVFANKDSHGALVAMEEYRIIPRGSAFLTNSLSGKTLDEQIKVLLEHRLFHLNRELAHGAEEKKRLEEGLKK